MPVGEEVIGEAIPIVPQRQVSIDSQRGITLLRQEAVRRIKLRQKTRVQELRGSQDVVTRFSIVLGFNLNESKMCLFKSCRRRKD